MAMSQIADPKVTIDSKAVACVLESSLALAADWPQLLAEYLAPLLHRLTESPHPPANSQPSVSGFDPRLFHVFISLQLSLSVVNYATADTRPTPILRKVYFSPPQRVLQTLREMPQELGIGQTGSGGGQGMAALEGLVAALEVSLRFVSARNSGYLGWCSWPVSLPLPSITQSSPSETDIYP